MTRINIICKIVLVWLLTISTVCSLAFAKQIQLKEWVPLSREQVELVKRNQDLTLTAKVDSLARILDHRISMSFFEDYRGYSPDPDRDYAFLIETAATLDSTEKSPQTVEAIRGIISIVDTSPEIENKTRVRSFLYIALAYAGGKAPEGELLEQLQQSEKLPYVTLTTLQAMQRSEVPIRSLPILLELTKNSWNYISSEMDVGPPNPQKFYPLRSAACKTLDVLGIICQEVAGVPEQLDNQWKTKVRTTEFKVNRTSLLDKLQQWLLSDNFEVWQPTTEIIYQIPGEDVQSLLLELLNGNKLSEEKRRALEKNKPT